MAASAWPIKKPVIFFSMRLLGNSHIAVGGLDHLEYYHSRRLHGLHPSQSPFNSRNYFHLIFCFGMLSIASKSQFLFSHFFSSSLQSMWEIAEVYFQLQHLLLRIISVGSTAVFGDVDLKQLLFLFNIQWLKALNWHCDANCECRGGSKVELQSV